MKDELDSVCNSGKGSVVWRVSVGIPFEQQIAVVHMVFIDFFSNNIGQSHTCCFLSVVLTGFLCGTLAQEGCANKGI